MVSNQKNQITAQNLEGLLIKHGTKDTASKDKAAKSLYGWHHAQYTPERWAKQLEYGYTICVGSFQTNDDGKYSHAKDFWQSTHMVFADGDNFTHEVDATETAISAWTEPDGLFIRFPALKEKVFAISESVSSMSIEKPHRRHRLMFLFDEPITTEADYHKVLQLLALEFPVIPAVERSPAQPVFGNAREENGAVDILQNVLSLEKYLSYEPPTPEPQMEPIPMPTPTPKAPPEKSITLDEFIRAYRIATLKPRPKGGHFVECPWKDKHASGKTGDTDSYIWENEDGTFAFYCSHATCKQQGNNNWATYREAVAPRKEPVPKRVVYTPDETGENQEPSLDLSPLDVSTDNVLPQFPDYEGELFIGSFKKLYDAYADTHVWSPEMLMAMGIGAMSFAARNVRVRTHEKADDVHHLNSYILAVGESDLTAKSQALKEVKKFMYHIEPEFDPLSNVQSIEGLLKALNEDEDTSEKYCLFDESAVVFENTRRQGTKNLFSGLNEIWLCPQTYATGRAAGTDKVENPYVCCWGNIPTKLISAVFRHEDMIGGSLNRWLPFFIQPKGETIRYPHAVSEEYNHWVQSLNAARNALDIRTFTFTEEADDSRFNWFKNLRETAIKKGEQKGESRFHTHAVKIAGIFALAENTPSNNNVELHHWKAALAVVRYLTKCSEYLFRNVGATRLGELENELLDILNQNNNEMTLNELTRKTQQFDRDERERILSLLEQDKHILRFTEKTKGRPRIKIRRIS